MEYRPIAIVPGRGWGYRKALLRRPTLFSRRSALAYTFCHFYSARRALSIRARYITRTYNTNFYISNVDFVLLFARVPLKRMYFEKIAALRRSYFPVLNRLCNRYLGYCSRRSRRRLSRAKHLNNPCLASHVCIDITLFEYISISAMKKYQRQSFWHAIP